MSQPRREKLVVPKSKALERVPFVEGMRGVAALYVVLGHLCSMSDPSKLAGKQSAAPAWFQAMIAPFAYGHLAVAAFIVISGYCLQFSLFSRGDGRIKDMPRFFAKRVRRILPAYYACLILSTLVAIHVTTQLPGMPFAMYLPVTTQNVLAHVFLVHNFSLDWMYKLNGVLWSIAIEAQLYIVFPLIVASLFRIGRWWTLVLASCAALVITACSHDAMKMYPWFLPLFVVGMVAAHLAYRPHPVWGPAARIARAGCYVFGGACVWAEWAGYSLPTTDVLAGMFVACLCYAGTVGRATPMVRFLSLKPLLGLGAFSYSLYLMHHPIQQLMYLVKPGFVAGEVGVFLYLLATLPVILLATWAFSLIFEKPFLTRPVPIRRRPEQLVPTSLPLQAAGSPRQPEAPSEPPKRPASQLSTDQPPHRYTLKKLPG